METATAMKTYNNPTVSSDSDIWRPTSKMADSFHERSSDNLISVDSGGTDETDEGVTTTLEGDLEPYVLTRSAVERINSIQVHEYNNEQFQPVVQVLHLERRAYCHDLIVSDGKQYFRVQSTAQHIRVNSIIRLVKFKVGRFSYKFISIMECEFVTQLDHVIGQPADIESGIKPALEKREGGLRSQPITIQRMLSAGNGKHNRLNYIPWVQVIKAEKSLDHYCLEISDGRDSTLAFCEESAYHLIDDGLVTPNSIIRITSFENKPSSFTTDRSHFWIHEGRFINQTEERIGEPVLSFNTSFQVMQKDESLDECDADKYGYEVNWSGAEDEVNLSEEPAVQLVTSHDYLEDGDNDDDDQYEYEVNSWSAEDEVDLSEEPVLLDTAQDYSKDNADTPVGRHTLSTDSIMAVHNMESNTTITDFNPTIQILDPDEPLIYYTHAELSDGTSKIKGLIKRREADGIVDKCILRVKEFEMEIGYNGSKYIVIRDFEYIGLTTDQIGSPMEINRKQKWSTIMNLTSKIPFRARDLDSINSQCEADMAELKSWNQMSLLTMDDWIAELTAIINSIAKRDADGFWKELMGASKRVQRKKAYRTSSIGIEERANLERKFKSLKAMLEAKKNVITSYFNHQVGSTPFAITNHLSFCTSISNTMKLHDIKGWIKECGRVFVNDRGDIGNCGISHMVVDPDLGCTDSTLKVHDVKSWMKQQPGFVGCEVNSSLTPDGIQPASTIIDTKQQLKYLVDRDLCAALKVHDIKSWMKHCSGDELDWHSYNHKNYGRIYRDMHNKNMLVNDAHLSNNKLVDCDLLGTMKLHDIKSWMKCVCYESGVCEEMKRVVRMTKAKDVFVGSNLARILVISNAVQSLVATLNRLSGIMTLHDLTGWLKELISRGDILGLKTMTKHQDFFGRLAGSHFCSWVLFSNPILVLFVPALNCGGVSVPSVG